MLVRNKWRAIKRYEELKNAHEAGDFTYAFEIIIIDEIAELMLNKETRDETEMLVQSITQAGRASGIIVIIGTQYPKDNVLTSIIKLNCPTIFGFNVSSPNASNVIIGDYESLIRLQIGQAMVRTNEYFKKPTKFKSFYVTDEQRKKLALDYKIAF